MYLAIYVEIETLSLVMLLFIFGKVKGDVGTKYAAQAFRQVIAINILLLLLDIIWVLGENGVYPFPQAVNALVNAMYMSLGCMLTFMWLIYSERKLSVTKKTSVWKKLLVALPLIAIVVMSVASIWTGWIFSVDAQSVYHRGPLYLFQVIITYFYAVVAAVHALVCGMKEHNRGTRKADFILASFLVLPLLGGTLETLLFGLPISLPASSLSLLIVFVNIQETRISQDPLTGLNNRRRANEYLDSKLTNPAKNTRLVLFLADVDSFKQINDTFGHTEGDKALIWVSQALKTVCNAYNAFLARFGGDEFCIVWEPAAQTTPEDFMEAVQQQLVQLREQEKLPYTLSVSMGYGRFSPQNATVYGLMNTADKMLYRNKARVHAGRAYEPSAS